MPRFIQFLQDTLRIKKDHRLVVTNLHFGTIPVRLFQPMAASPSPQRGFIFFHGGASVCGSLGKMLPCGLIYMHNLTHPSQENLVGVPLRTQ